MEELLKQVCEKPFKPSNFTVYSILEEDGFITELQGMFGQRYSVDDFEYVVIELSTKEKNGILYRMSFIMDKLRELKNFMEKEIQDNPIASKVRVYINKDKAFVFVAKLKEFDLVDRINEIKIGNETKASLPIKD
jgi:hypothetical protein